MSFLENFRDACEEVADVVEERKSLIFLIGGLVLGAATTVVAVSEGVEASKHLAEVHETEEYKEMTKPMQVVTNVKEAAPFYIGAGVFFGFAAYCLIKSYMVNMTEVATLTGLLSIAERKNREYDIYKQKVREAVGKNKEKKIEAETLKEQVKEDPPASEYTMSGDGKMLMRIMDTGTYIRSTPQAIAEAEKIITHRLSYEDFASLYDLLYEADVENIRDIEALQLLGWPCGSMPEAEFVPVMMEDGVTTITGVRFFENSDDMLARIMAGKHNR